MTDVDGLNSGFARDLLEEYLENPDAVPASGANSSRAATATSSRPIPASLVCWRLLEDGRGSGSDSAAPLPAAAPAEATPQTEPASDEGCWARSQPRWPSSRRTACTAISRPISIPSDRSHPEIPRSSPSG